MIFDYLVAMADTPSHSTSTTSSNTLARPGQFENKLIEKIADFARKGLEGSANTQRAYAADLASFRSWCQSRGIEAPLPAEAGTVAAYATELAEQGRKWSTLTRHLAALSKWHQLYGPDNPVRDPRVAAVLEGIKRSKGTRQKQAPAWTLPRLKAWVKALPTATAADNRNKALLLLGFTGAFRRSELVALDIENLRFSEEGLTVVYFGSKTNQYGEQEEKAIFYSPDPQLCPIRAVQAWVAVLGRESGALFVRVRKGDRLSFERLTDKTVDDLVKRHFGKNYSAHSLRASFVTIAKVNGADDSEIMRQTKHKTPLMIQRYTRLETIRLHNAGMKLGL
jgi:site-specific recombinase XerD